MNDHEPQTNPGVSIEGSAPSEAPAVPPPSVYRGKGKIARLPKNARDKINSMLQDGFAYADILRELGDLGKDLNQGHLCEWRKRGFQDWLTEQRFIERLRARQETPGELVRDFDATEVNHAALQLGSLQIFEALRDPGSGSLDEKLGGNAAAFARLLNALARASRETMQLQKYREACARARAALQPIKNPDRTLSDTERHAIVQHVDHILGLGPAEDGTTQNQKINAAQPQADVPPAALGIVTVHAPKPLNSSTPKLLNS